LLLVDARRGLLRQVSTRHGLLSPIVCSLLPDAVGDLWLGIYAGIVRYQPRTGHLVTLTTADGLADNECNYQSAFRDASGQLYFGGTKGVTQLAPERLRLAFSPRRRLVVAQLSQRADGDTLVRYRFPPPAPAPPCGYATKARWPCRWPSPTT
jgi:ligand-binding sensor domain-containing protein